jgi:MbtH protein
MGTPRRKDGATYKVVVNPEEQYSIMRTDKGLALGWRDTGFEGTKDDCLAHIEQVWTDMQPLSVRRDP